jgi:hypothetical protein
LNAVLNSAIHLVQNNSPLIFTGFKSDIFFSFYWIEP